MEKKKREDFNFDFDFGKENERRVLEGVGVGVGVVLEEYQKAGWVPGVPPNVVLRGGTERR